MSVLLTTIHDPSGRLLGIDNIESLIDNASSAYEKCFANMTKATHPSLRRMLKSKFTCIESSAGTQGEHMMSLVRKARGRTFHYCDFDRLLHWQSTYPKELLMIQKKISSKEGFTFIGRTKRAFDTHPPVQKDTEIATNIIMSHYMRRQIDMCSGTFGFDKKTRTAFASIKGDVRDVRFLAQFLKQIKKKGIAFSSIEAEGTEWETPDVYRKEIRKQGYKTWLAKFQSHEEWRRRTDYINQIAEVLYGKRGS